MLSLVWHHIIFLSVIILKIKNCYAEGHDAVCRYGECPCTECFYTETHLAQFKTVFL
jgi:hypothetical protein